MPDRDSALGAALEVYLRQRASAIHAARAAGPFGWSVPSMEKGLQNAKAKANERLETLIESAQDAAFRSLGCATPEAQTALRELVEANLELTRQEERLNGAPLREIHDIVKSVKMAGQRGIDARRTFAKLATPPEEGR